MFSRYLRSVEEWESLADALAFGADVTSSTGNPEATTVGVERDRSGGPEELIPLFGWERLWEDLGRLEGLPPSELARARGNFRCGIFCDGDGFSGCCCWYEDKVGG